MSALGSLVVSLSANIAKFESAMNRANYIANSNMRAMIGAARGLQASIDALPTSLLKIGGATAGITAVTMLMTKAIKTTDEFRVSTIGIAAALTNMAAPGQGSMEDIFKRNLHYAKEMYTAIEKEASKHFAGPQDTVKGYNQLVQQGYAVRLDEVAALGTLVDKIKLVTAGQDQEKQINQEIRSLMDGQARAGSALATELKTRLGPAWVEIVQKHKEAGDLLKYLESLWPGLAAATKEVQGTLTAQGTTLQGHMAFLGREGLGGLYDDLVGSVTEINEWLKKHEDLVAGGIARGWIVVKDVVGGVYGVLSEVLSVMAQLVTHAGRFAQFWLGISSAGPWNQMAKWLASSPSGTGGMMGGELTTFGQTTGGYTGSWESEANKLGPPKVVPPARDDLGKGAAGAARSLEAAQRQLENFLQTMRGETAKAAGDSLAAADAWLGKQTLVLDRLEDKVGASEEARLALADAYGSKREKIEEDYQSWLAKESEDTYAQIEIEMRGYLSRYQGCADAEANVAAVKNRKIWEQDVKVYSDRRNLEKGLYDSLASSLPLLGDQIAAKQKALEIEIDLSQYTLERAILEQKMAPAMADELRGLQALTNQAKKYALEREGWSTGGVVGGLNLVAEDLRKESSTAIAFGVRDGFLKARDFAADTMTSFFMSIFKKDKVQFKKIGQDLAANIASGLTRIAATNISEFFINQFAIILGSWIMTQEGMTAASIAGNSARNAAMMQEGQTGIGIFGMIGKAKVLVEAGQAGAAGFRSVMQTLPFPANIIAAPIVAAAAFAATLAFGDMFGGGGGNLSYGGVAAPGPQIMHEGGLVKARGYYPGLRLGEVPTILQEDERVLSRSQNRDYEAGRDGGQAPQVSMPVNITINPRQEMTKSDYNRHARMIVEALDQELGRSGYHLRGNRR